MLFELVATNRTARTKWFGLCKRLRAKNNTGRTFLASLELPKQAGATGIQLYSHLKFLNLKRFNEERNRLVWVSAWYEVKKGNIAISGLSAFFE
ncbi:MAG TPA: hypothetical protein PLM53_12895 [Spirochaetota bacterium]|nr:hypothetical protein [Spirochaetota bacterium]HPC40698.1 hypothetical protein [Spirochaetota bacterium]HPL18683.1 hypothetical protein [Spirochaetota bacterium]HQF09394.1 hypothetical protein [Spirochaetota bacterium]HQH97992.1 hypothetical protein [Spirochaetota bacterium]